VEGFHVPGTHGERGELLRRIGDAIGRRSGSLEWYYRMKEKRRWSFPWWLIGMELDVVVEGSLLRDA